jgi:ATP-binding cassette subfamily B (MDR/TAP) protein 1
MSLLFGNLTQDFVSFGTTIVEAAGGNETAIANVPAAAASFRKVAAQDASYLVYIGKQHSS